MLAWQNAYVDDFCAIVLDADRVRIRRFTRNDNAANKCAVFYVCVFVGQCIPAIQDPVTEAIRDPPVNDSDSWVFLADYSFGHEEKLSLRKSLSSDRTMN